MINNFNATTSPNNTNDITQGYAIGSKWINITDQSIFICVRATQDDAVWKQISEVIQGTNIGNKGVDIFKGATDGVLKFKKLMVGSNRLEVANTGKDEIFFDVLDSNINHDRLEGFYPSRHIDHSQVSILTGHGLVGGGDITENRIIKFNINALTNDTNPDGSSDYVLTYDASSNDHKKVLINNLPSKLFVRKCDLYYDPAPGVSQQYSTSWFDIPLNTERMIDTSFSHTANSPEIVINASGNYNISARCTSNNINSQSQMRIAINRENTTYTQLDGSIGYMSGNGFSTVTIPIILELNMGDKIKMQIMRISGVGPTYIVPEGCGIVMHNV